MCVLLWTLNLLFSSINSVVSIICQSTKIRPKSAIKRGVVFIVIFLPVLILLVTCFIFPFFHFFLHTHFYPRFSYPFVFFGLSRARRIIRVLKAFSIFFLWNFNKCNGKSFARCIMGKFIWTTNWFTY